MRKFLLIAVFSFVIFINPIFANKGGGEKLGCTPTITTNALTSNVICSGSFVTVNFSFTDCVFPGNIFSVELSDASGSFTTATNIGNVSSTVAVPIDAFIPTSIVAGSNYRIRVVSSNPVAFGTDNGVDITILPKPVASFTVNNSLQCLNNNSFIFTNNSTGNIAGYNWSFGDGINSSQTSPTYTFNNAGNYNVTLKAIGSNGCIDSMAQVVTVHPKPNVNFSIVKDSLCIGSLFEMTNNSNISSGTISHLWLFDDGTNSNSYNVTKSFLTVGNHQIKLIETSDKGCKDSLSKIVFVFNQPTPNFTINTIQQCLKSNLYNFQNTSVGFTLSSWNFGDGNFSTLTSPSKSYSLAGNYIVQLKVQNSRGCVDSISKTVNVISSPTAAFTHSATGVCNANLTVTFTNQSTGVDFTQLWNFGDGSTSTALNPSKTYATAGAYNVKLVITNANGCKDSITQTIFIASKPQVNYTINNASQCLSGNLFSFTNLTSGAVSYIWDFGDGTTSILTNPTKSFNNNGIYNVKLIATNSNGCKDSFTQAIIVFEKPTASFSLPNNNICSSTLTINPTNNSTGLSNTYLWSFGDGTTSTSVNPSKTYSSAGTYIIKLVATNNHGCKDSVQQTITISTAPIANFSINNNSQCAVNNVFSFNNSSTGAISYLWDFADGTTSILSNPNKAYITPGLYNVKLIATNSNGCKDSITKTVSVLEKPTANFTLPNNSICSNSLTISPTGTLNSYTWYFGDGTTSSLINPTKTYLTAGNYTIKLIAVNSNGCKDSIEQSISIATNPIANFTVNSSSQCAVNNVFAFTNLSTNANSYFWDFSDGITSILSNPSKAFLNSGTYNVKLVACNVNGCKDSIIKPVTVLEKPTAAFVLNSASNCSSSLTISPTNNSTGVGNSYVWYFGDGSTSTLTDPTKTFAAIGTYTIKLIVTNGNGCKDSTEKSITFSTAPIANFSINSSVQCGTNNLFAFSNLSTGSSSYFWDFGDGITSTVANPSKSYTNSGTYIVKLVARSVNGCADSTTKSVTVGVGPVAQFTYPGLGNNCINNLTIPFTNNSTNAISYLWYFGDGTTSNLTNPTKTYAAYGNYIVKLVATSSNGCKDSLMLTLQLAATPTASFNVNNSSQCLNNNSFIFTNTSAATGVSYFWDFGDGTVSTLTNPTKNYSVTGNYTVKLTVINAAGCSSTISQNIIVNNALIANFSISGYDNCAIGNVLTFNNNSSGTGASYFWNFGDGTTSTLQNPTKTYTSVGTFTVTLKISNGSCVDSSSKVLSFQTKPISSFTINTTTQCLKNNSYSFSNNSVGAISYLWDFGDGTTSTLQNPTKSYTVSGNFTVKLTATNAAGCSVTSSQIISVNSALIADFTIIGYNNCALNTALTFNNTSTGLGTGTTSLWNFGDGTTSTSNNPIKTYTVAGNYTITYKITNGTCSDSISKTISLQTKPTASFIVNNNSQCLSGNNFSFTNQSSGSIVGYYWNFGDSTSSNLQNPTKTYTTSGNYTVVLTVTNSNGCTDQSSVVVSVKGTPNLSFTINANVQCLIGNVFTFINTSGTQAGVSYYWNFGDGLNSTKDTISKTYAFIGTYNVSLVATSGTNCKDSVVKTISVINKPTPSFTTTTSSDCNSFSIIFNNTTSISNAINYKWYFGDGSSSTEKNPTHNYSNSGSYTVKLVATLNSGCADSVTLNIFVASKPVASFSSNANSNPCSAIHIVNFTNTSSGNITNYLWSFGDGTTSNSIHPQKIYSSPGTYIVSLTVNNANGCSNSITQTITILPKINAAFALSSLSQCFNNNSFSFTSLANIGNNNVNYFWNLGDGTTSTSSSITKSYNLPGTYVVSLTVNNLTSGCSDMVSQAITVYPKVTASLTSSGVICQGNSFVINTTLIGKPPFQLTFNNGLKDSTITNISSNIVGISVSPTTTTTYKIVSLSDANCTASIADLSNSQSVVTVQQISFTSQPKSIVACVGNKIKLSSTINTNSSSVVYQWQKNAVNILGANTDSLIINNATITDNGVYRLAVIMPCGTVYSNEATVTIEPQPAPPAFTAIVGLCQNEIANPLQASGNYLRWYNVATGGIASSSAPIPSTSIIGTQQYWVSNSNSSNSCESPRYLITVNVSAAPIINVVVVGNLAIQPSQTVQLTATTNSSTTTIKWYKNGIYVGPSPNNSITLYIQDTGVYVAEATNVEGCKIKSKEFFVGRRSSGDNVTPSNPLVLYPNPASTIITGYFNNPINEVAEVRLVNMWGQILQTKTINFISPQQKFNFIVSNLKADIYAIEIINSKGFSTARNLFIKAN
jgi:PKD repeat protein